MSERRYRLDGVKVAETAALLSRRVDERFEGSGLSRVTSHLSSVCRSAERTTRELEAANYLLRATMYAIALGAVTGVWLIARRLHVAEETLSRLASFVEVVDAAVSSLVFLGAALVFLWSLEARLKRKRALDAMHELRSLAHVIDMHQLTKDPERLLSTTQRTASSPDLALNAFELGRYLDYCSESLALLAKVAALYVERLFDPVVLASADQIEALANGLARKIWHKINVLDSLSASGRLGPDASHP